MRFQEFSKLNLEHFAKVVWKWKFEGLCKFHALENLLVLEIHPFYSFHAARLVINNFHIQFNSSSKSKNHNFKNIFQIAQAKSQSSSAVNW